jgi:hypothetical protein
MTDRRPAMTSTCPVAGRIENVKQALLTACAVVAIGVSGCEERRSEPMIKLDKAVQDSQKRVEDAQHKLDEAN